MTVDLNTSDLKWNVCTNAKRTLGFLRLPRDLQLPGSVESWSLNLLGTFRDLFVLP